MSDKIQEMKRRYQQDIVEEKLVRRKHEGQEQQDW